MPLPSACRVQAWPCAPWAPSRPAFRLAKPRLSGAAALREHSEALNILHPPSSSLSCPRGPATARKSPHQRLPLPAPAPHSPAPPCTPSQSDPDPELHPVLSIPAPSLSTAPVLTCNPDSLTTGQAGSLRPRASPNPNPRLWSLPTLLVSRGKHLNRHLHEHYVPGSVLKHFPGAPGWLSL